ncbi:MAG: cysteine desulfuration protein SufE [Saprospiraceae bacterium]|jgi:cysteine desulfuration protein SufE
MNIEVAAGEILEDFDLFDDWEDKYEYIISLGKELEVMPDEQKVEENLVKGCQSRVWLNAKLEGGKVIFSADSDAIITKGIIALLVKILSNQSAEEIAKNDFSFIDKIGLKEHLSPNRSNGLVGMMKKMKSYALAYS